MLDIVDTRDAGSRGVTSGTRSTSRSFSLTPSHLIACMQVIDMASSREPLVQRLEVANSVMLTFHGLRNANVRDRDTRCA